MLPKQEQKQTIKMASRFYVLAFLLFVLLILSSCEQTQDTQSSPSKIGNKQTAATVIKVMDGDSVILRLSGGQEQEARLFGIDAPEYKQPYGKQSKTDLQNLVLRKAVLVVSKGRDRYQREIVLLTRRQDGLLVNRAMVEQGSAWVYTQYQPDQKWLTLEGEARKSKKGLWSLPTAQRQPPWQWRKR